MKFQSLLLALALAILAATDCPAQDEDLVYPPPQEREMSVSLFNGKDFTGWTFYSRGTNAPSQTWSVTNGVIHCTGTPSGYIRSTGIYSNYFLTVSWRFVKVAPKADNTGILVHIQPPDKVWPQCVQVQGKHTRHGDLFVMAGAECKEHKGQDANTPVPLRGDSVERPVGEWNKCEIVCLHGKVAAFVNGKFVNEITGCTVDSGHIGIQSEGAEIEIRAIAYCPLKY